MSNKLPAHDRSTWDIPNLQEETEDAEDLRWKFFPVFLCSSPFFMVPRAPDPINVPDNRPEAGHEEYFHTAAYNAWSRKNACGWLKKFVHGLAAPATGW